MANESKSEQNYHYWQAILANLIHSTLITFIASTFFSILDTLFYKDLSTKNV